MTVLASVMMPIPTWGPCSWHSLTVLYRFYAKILKGGSARANSLIEQGLQAEDEG